jgi:hypothetical protein
MTAILAPPLRFRGVDNNGLALVAGLLNSYIAGTSTPQATYVDSTQTTQNTNPIILDARGECDLWLDPTKVYKFTLTDQFGNPFGTTDQVQGSLTAAALTQAMVGAALYPQTAAEIAASVVPTFYFYPPGDVRRYGGVSGSDVVSATTQAAASNRQVIFPTGFVAPMATIPTVPSGVVLAAQPGSSFSGAGAVNFSLNSNASYQFNIVEGDVVTGPAFRDVMKIAHTYGGASMQGGRQSLEVQSSLTNASSVSNTNRNYAAGFFQMNAVANDTGTNPTGAGTSAGAGFGLGALFVMSNGATAWLNGTAAEFNIACQAGSSLFYRSGIQICELASSAVQGSIFDGALCISRQTGAIGWQNAILFCSGNGSQPVTASGTLIATQGAYTTTNGINLTSYTFTGQSFAATGFAVQGNGLQLNLGVSGSAHQIQQTTSGAANYDTRIVSQSGTGATGAGDLLINSGKLGFYSASAGVAKQTITGAKAGNAALVSLMPALAALGLFIDSTT